MISLSIYITAVTLGIDIFTDLKRWKEEKKINHVRGALLRCIGLIPACYFAGWFSGVLLVSYWIAFNGILSALKGLSFWYVGTTSTIDKAINKLPKWAYPFLQGLLLAVAIIVYIKNPGHGFRG